MKEIRVQRRIEAPVETVFARAADLEALPRSIAAIKKVEVLTPGAVGRGTRFLETRLMFGREATEEMEIAEFDPPRRIVLGAESRGCRYRSEFTFRPSGSGTEVEMTFGAAPLTLAAKVMSLLARPMMKSLARTCAKDLEDLKAAVERGS